MYTLREDILQKISENDESYYSIMDTYNNEMFQFKSIEERPLTAAVSVSLPAYNNFSKIIMFWSLRFARGTEFQTFDTSSTLGWNKIIRKFHSHR